MSQIYLRAVRGGDSDFQRVDPPLETGGGDGNDGDMRERLARLEAVLSSLATKGDMGELRADFERGQKENRAWMLATVLALFAGIIGSGGLILAASKPQPAAVVPAPAPSPIIIQVPAQAVPPPPTPTHSPSAPTP